MNAGGYSGLEICSAAPVVPAHRLGRRGRKRFWAVLLNCVLLVVMNGAGATATVYTDRAQFMQALATAPSSDNFLGYGLGPIPRGAQLGEFTYQFDPTATQPAIVIGDGTGNLLGGYPYSVFVAWDTVSLSLTDSNTAPGDRLRAFGGDYYYAPSAFGVTSNTYLLTLGDGLGQGQSAGNLPLTGDGGSFFLGLIAAPGAEFTSVKLSVVQSDTNTIVPACQVSNLVYLKVQANPPLFSAMGLSGGTLTLQGSGGMPATVFMCVLRPMSRCRGFSGRASQPITSMPMAISQFPTSGTHKRRPGFTRWKSPDKTAAMLNQ